jgi:hypothetical protein
VPGCHSLLQARRAPAPQAGCRGCLRTPPCLACASLSPAQGSTPCASRNSGQSAEVQRGATRYQPPFNSSRTTRARRRGSEGAAAAPQQRAAAPLLSVEVQRVAPTTPQPPPQAAAAPQGRAQRFKCCRRHHSLLRGQHLTPAGHTGSEGADGCTSTFALPGPTDASAWTTVGRARKVDRHPTSHHARSQSKSSPPFQRQPAHVPAADSLQQLSRPPLSPGPLWFLLPHATFGDSCRGSQAPVAFSSTSSPGVSVNSTPTTGSSTKRSGGCSPCHASYGLCCHRPGHRIG